MAIVGCPECAAQISDKAEKCPQCGVPLAKQFCKFCGEKIDTDCVICPKCGKQLKEIGGNDKNIIINNNNNASSSSSATATVVGVGGARVGRAVNKWVSFFLCLFLGFFGAHKFYEGKIGTGILYLFTCGLFFIGWIIDLLNILGKPNPYYVS